MLIIFQVYCSIEHFSVLFYACLKEGNVARLNGVLEIVTRLFKNAHFRVPNLSDSGCISPSVSTFLTDNNIVSMLIVLRGYFKGQGLF